MMKTQQQEAAKGLQDALMQAAFDAQGNDEAKSLVSLENTGKTSAEPPKRRVGDGTPGPGRPKGSVPKVTKTIRDAVMQAFDEVGGPAYLVRLANGTQSDRAAFTSLLNKVLPTQINANVEGGIQVQLSWLGQRSIGTVTAQQAEQVTQVVDLERDSAGKYRIKDQDTPPAGGDAAGRRQEGVEDA